MAHGVLAQVDAGVHGTRYEYVLTPKGKDLATLMTALQQWGDRWIYGEGREPLLTLDRRSGRPIPRLRILDEQGGPLAGRDMVLAPGPGGEQADARPIRWKISGPAKVAPHVPPGSSMGPRHA